MRRLLLLAYLRTFKHISIFAKSCLRSMTVCCESFDSASACDISFSLISSSWRLTTPSLYKEVKSSKRSFFSFRYDSFCSNAWWLLTICALSCDLFSFSCPSERNSSGALFRNVNCPPIGNMGGGGGISVLLNCCVFGLGKDLWVSDLLTATNFDVS